MIVIQSQTHGCKVAEGRPNTKIERILLVIKTSVIRNLLKCLRIDESTDNGVPFFVKRYLEVSGNYHVFIEFEGANIINELWKGAVYGSFIIIVWVRAVGGLAALKAGV
jgi:hypothetical protein